MDDYLDHVRQKPCIACGAPPPSDPHHLLSGVMGGKGSDASCIPLCREHHREYHDKGHAAFEKAHGFTRKRGLWFFAWRARQRYHKQTDTP